jgi:hypothetical protein
MQVGRTLDVANVTGGRIANHRALRVREFIGEHLGAPEKADAVALRQSVRDLPPSIQCTLGALAPTVRRLNLQLDLAT